MDLDYLELFWRLLPECAVTLAAAFVLGVDLLGMRSHSLRERLNVGAAIATAGCLVAALLALVTSEPAAFGEGMLVLDGLSRVMKVILLVLAILAVWISCGSIVTDHVGEYYLMLLLATVGMMLLVSTEHVLMIFVSLELLSLSLYVMTAFDKRSVESAEAGLKYFLFGGLSAAFMLFGLSWVYGLTGELELSRIAVVAGAQGMNPLLAVALILVVVGFGFKVAAVPFHLWAPDAYQGAPLASAAFIASGSKVASFFVLARVLLIGFEGAEGNGALSQFASGWIPLVAMVAGLSVVLGNLAALAQTNVRRLLAYSAIAQAGYILVGLLGSAPQGMVSVLFYAVTYALTTIGAFGVVALVRHRTGREDIEAFAGLSRDAPMLSFCMLIFLLSLAGIPPLAGFFGKFYLFAAAMGRGFEHSELLWLVALAVAMSAVSLYYYLKVLKQIYVVERPAPVQNPEAGSAALSVVVGVTAMTVVIFGCLPGLLIDVLLPAVRSAGF